MANFASPRFLFRRRCEAVHRRIPVWVAGAPGLGCAKGLEGVGFPWGELLGTSTGCREDASGGSRELPEWDYQRDCVGVGLLGLGDV